MLIIWYAYKINGTFIGISVMGSVYNVHVSGIHSPTQGYSLMNIIIVYHKA